jgi:predicted protein tyrosine phosphatase
MPQEKIEILLSKNKLIKSLTISFFLLVCSLAIIIYQPKIDHFIFGNMMLMLPASYFMVIITSFSLYNTSIKIFDKKPGIKIDNAGILDNSGSNSIGLITWNDINFIVEYKNQLSAKRVQKSISIIVKNPDDYISKQSNFMKRTLMKNNMKYAGSPILISANNLKINFEQLKTILTEKFAEHNV